MIIKAKKVFNGERFLTDHQIVVEDGKVKEILSIDSSVQPVHQDQVIDFGSATVVPGFIDIHINGGGGILFNQDLSQSGLSTIVETHARFGTTGIVPTFITDELEKTGRAMTLVDQVVKDRSVPGILGIHLEGPFIDLQYRGTHSPDWIQTPTDRKIDFLIESASHSRNRKVMTLAPEKFSFSQLEKLTQAEFTLLAGHTGASYESLKARSKWIKGFTHFCNGLGTLSAREPKSIGFVLADPKKDFWLSLIVDQYHIHSAVMKILFDLYPSNRFLLITDSMPLIGTTHRSFFLQGKEIRKNENFLVDEKGIISGTVLSMIEAVERMNRIKESYFSTEEVLRMASLYPAQFLGLNQEESLKYGRIDQGYQASLTVIGGLLDQEQDQSLRVLATMIDGNWIYQE